uniref:Uncharacterized protein n=1 Tax=Plectus sambesii TaxID=2011161 RepID=A0A914VFX5_9BILA
MRFIRADGGAFIDKAVIERRRGVEGPVRHLLLPQPTLTARTPRLRCGVLPRWFAPPRNTAGLRRLEKRRKTAVGRAAPLRPGSLVSAAPASGRPHLVEKREREPVSRLISRRSQQSTHQSYLRVIGDGAIRYNGLRKRGGGRCVREREPPLCTRLQSCARPTVAKDGCARASVSSASGHDRCLSPAGQSSVAPSGP